MIFGFTWKSRIQQWINGWLHVCFCSVQLSLPLHKYLWSSSTCTIKNGISVSGGKSGLFTLSGQQVAIVTKRQRRRQRWMWVNRRRDARWERRGMDGWVDEWESVCAIVPVTVLMSSRSKPEPDKKTVVTAARESGWYTVQTFHSKSYKNQVRYIIT